MRRNTKADLEPSLRDPRTAATRSIGSTGLSKGLDSGCMPVMARYTVYYLRSKAYVKFRVCNGAMKFSASAMASSGLASSKRAIHNVAREL